MKKNTFLKIIVIIIIALLLSCRSIVVYKEKEPFIYPELIEPDENEKNGINLKIHLPETYKTILNDQSIQYKYLSKDKKFNNLIGKEYNNHNNKLSINKWKNEIEIDNSNYNQKFLIDNKLFFGAIILDKNNKPIKIIRDDRENIAKFADLLLIENSKYYLPDKIIKINDEWSYNYADKTEKMTFYKKKTKIKSTKYFQIDIDAKFKLIGYTNFNGIRCALIESNIICNKADFFIDSIHIGKKKGGTMVYEISIKNLLYLDYKNEKVLFVKSFVKNIAKGNYLENWGKSIDDVIINVNKEYEGYINNNETFIAQYFYDYFY